MKYWFIFVLFAGCETEIARPVTTPSGGSGFTIECRQTREQCLEKAGEACGSQGYYVLSESHHGADWTLWSPGAWKPGFSVMIACGQPQNGYTPPPIATQAPEHRIHCHSHSYGGHDDMTCTEK